MLPIEEEVGGFCPDKFRQKTNGQREKDVSGRVKKMRPRLQKQYVVSGAVTFDQKRVGQDVNDSDKTDRADQSHQKAVSAQPDNGALGRLA